MIGLLMEITYQVVDTKDQVMEEMVVLMVFIAMDKRKELVKDYINCLIDKIK